MATCALAVKYRPSTFEDMVEQSVSSTILKSLCESKDLACRNFLLIGPAGTGKAQPLYSKVLTPDGFISMGDVKVGTTVFTAHGNRAAVSAIYPQGVRAIYEIELQDRTCIRVSDEHLNVFYRYNQDTKQREDFCMTTVELIEFFHRSRFKLRMDVPVVDWHATSLPVDPYLLGALLGDGCLSNNLSFSNSEVDVIHAVDSILRRDWGKMLRQSPSSNVDYDIVDVNYARHKYTFMYKGTSYNSTHAIQTQLVHEGYPKFDGATLVKLGQGRAPRVIEEYPELDGALSCEIDDNYKPWTSGDPFRTALRELGICTRSTNKHIPKEYLLADRASRIALLQGLFDTDGYIDGGGSCTFTTCSDQLSDDFAFLVRSLGIRDTVVAHPSKYKSGDAHIYTGATAYEHYLKIPDDVEFCTSAKHVGRKRTRQHPPMRNIVDIRYVGDEECQCIYVDHDDHTYISDGFIPTHNTTTARLVANLLNDGKGTPIEVDAASNGGVEAIRELIQQARSYPVGSQYKIIIVDEVHAISPAGWSSLLKPLEEGVGNTVWILCTTNPEKIPATIISRVQTFKLSKISTAGIFNRLKYIMDSEIAEGRKLSYTDDALHLIAKIANGGMRDAITMLDQALTYSPDLDSRTVEASLNLPNYDDFFELLGAYAKRDNATIVSTIQRVYDSGVNFHKWFENFQAFTMNIVKYIFTKDFDCTTIPKHYEDKIAKYSQPHAAICLTLSNRLLTIIRDTKSSQYLQEIALSYLCSIPKKEA